MLPKTNPNERRLTRHPYLKRQRDPLVGEAILFYISFRSSKLYLHCNNVTIKMVKMFR